MKFLLFYTILQGGTRSDEVVSYVHRRRSGRVWDSVRTTVQVGYCISRARIFMSMDRGNLCF